MSGDLYTLKQEATSLPVSLDEARQYLRADPSEDLSVGLLLRAAVVHAEKYTGVDFRTNTWTLTRDGFPSNSRICLDKAEVASVTSVSRLVWDDVSENVLTAVPSTDYYLKAGVGASEVLLLGSSPLGSTAAGSWPDNVSEQQPEANVEVEFVMGIPDLIEKAQAGILKLLAAFWVNRGDALAALQGTGRGQVALASDLGAQSGANADLDFYLVERV